MKQMMELLKRHYEKVLLGVVLLGLVVGAAFLPLMISGERQILEDKRMILARPPKPLPPLNLSQHEDLIQRAGTRMTLDLSRTNRIFNPMRWQRMADGRLIKVPTEGPASLCQVSNITALYFICALERVEPSDSGPRYCISLMHQTLRRKMGPFFVSRGDKKEYAFPGEKKEWFILSQVEGPPDDPKLTLQMSDSPTPVSVARNAPFKRVEGYLADLYFPPEKKYFANARRKGDSLSFAGEDYIIVDIKQDMVVLSAKSNGKKTPILFNSGS